MLYAITDRQICGSDDPARRLINQAEIWAANGVSFIQLREKDLPSRGQVELAKLILRLLRGSRTRLLINRRADVALAAGAHGVHLPSGQDELSPEEIRAIFARTESGRKQPCISVSCHTVAEVVRAREQKADAILFAPVFEKIIAADRQQRLPGSGLQWLRQACQAAAPVPVFALGGVTAGNAPQCLEAGAAGIAAIRLLQQPASVWRHLAEP